MRPADPPRRDPSTDGTSRRRRSVPTRVLADKLVVARPLDGAPVVLAPTAAFVWRVLERWTTTAALDRLLAEAFPDVDEDDRLHARSEIVAMLEDEDLVERG